MPSPVLRGIEFRTNIYESLWFVAPYVVPGCNRANEADTEGRRGRESAKVEEESTVKV